MRLPSKVARLDKVLVSTSESLVVANVYDISDLELYLDTSGETKPTDTRTQ